MLCAPAHGPVGDISGGYTKPNSALAAHRGRDYERAVFLTHILAALALLSLALTVWQWLAARRFPLHRRYPQQPEGLRFGAKGGPMAANGPRRLSALLPGVTLLKPLKGCDEHTEACLRSWFAQEYAGEVQILFGVASAADPACGIVKKLHAEFPQYDAQLVVCPERLGPNAKVSKLAQLEPLARHEIIVVSDADVRVPADMLANLVVPLAPSPASSKSGKVAAGAGAGSVGLVNCFYRLANPTTLALRWEAIAINADFWSQVLQSANIRSLDFALGAVMATRRQQLAEMGGFKALVDCLADDYQLGHRLAQRGHRIELCPVVAECWSAPMDWREVWRHQLRWARTIRVCQPLPYFFSILNNVTFWSLAWMAAGVTEPVGSRTIVSGDFVGSFEVHWVCVGAAICLLTRVTVALNLQSLLSSPSSTCWRYFWLVPVKDLLQFAVWAGAFLGSHVEWRGEGYRLRRDGTLQPG